MVSYPSLQNITIVEEGATECEVSGRLLANLPARVSELVSNYPNCYPTHRQSEMRAAGAKIDPASLFLSPSTPGDGQAGHSDSGVSVSSLLSQVIQGGLEGLLSNLSSVLGHNMEKLLNLVWSLRSSFYPHLALSTTDMIGQFIPVRQWSSAHIKCIAWHPHTPKLAVAYQDDSICVLSTDPSVTTQPILKHAAMKNISSMSWRPLSGGQLAVGCEAGICMWRVDPTSLVSRPSSSCLTRLSSPGHTPVTELAWSPDGRLLASGSAADTRIHVWCVETGQWDSVTRSGGGVTLLRWSGDSKKIFCGTPGIVFRVWSTDTWSPDRWTVGGGRGRVSAASWAPDSSHLLFSTTEEAVLYCVSFLGEGESAVPLFDLTKHALDSGEVVGGLVQDIQFDPSGHRVAVTFTNTNSVCLLRSRPGQARLSNVGWIKSSDPQEFPICVQFQKDKVEYGAVLTVVWSNKRVQHLPLVFSLQDDLLTTNEVQNNTVEELFTSF